MLRVAEVAAEQDLVAGDDAVRLQRGAPARHHRRGVQGAQLQLLGRRGRPWRRQDHEVSN